jgi:RNA helicase
MAQLKEKRSRNWMGVAYHPTEPTHHHGLSGETDLSTLLTRVIPTAIPSFIAYATYGVELCPTTQTPHLQMFFKFKNDQSLTNLISKFGALLGFPNTIAFKLADDNVDECIKYCQKDGQFSEFGQRPKGQGKRSDLDAVCSAISTGQSSLEIFTNFGSSFLKHHNGIAKAICLVAPPRDFTTEVYWCWGSTGTGKSKWVYQTCDRNQLFVKDGATKWFCGYQGQKNIVFDDFRPSKDLPFASLLKMFDRYPMTVEMKGGHVNFAPERIFITTPLPPTATFEHLDWIGTEAINQLLRRITKVIEFSDALKNSDYVLLSPFVKVTNTWTHSVAQTTTTATAGSATTERPSTRTYQTHQTLSQDSTASMDQEDTAISGDSEPEDSVFLQNEEPSQDSSQQSEDSFIVSDSVLTQQEPPTCAKPVLQRSKPSAYLAEMLRQAKAANASGTTKQTNNTAGRKRKMVVLSSSSESSDSN